MKSYYFPDETTITLNLDTDSKLIKNLMAQDYLYYGINNGKIYWYLSNTDTKKWIHVDRYHYDAQSLKKRYYNSSDKTKIVLKIKRYMV